MTVVVAVSCDDGSVVMGGDSFCGDAEIVNLCKKPKVYQVGPVGVGVSGLVRAETVLDRVLREHIPDKKNITEEWLTTDLADEIHDAMKEHGVMKDKSGYHELKDSAYLLTFGGQIFFLDEDFGVWDSRRVIAAIGAGRQFAYGAMGALYSSEYSEVIRTTANQGKPSVDFAEKMVRTALEVTAQWSPWVTPPFEVIKIASSDSE